VVTVQGALVDTWRDARLYAAAVGVFVYFWRRDVLVTVLGGMAVYLPLRLGLGW
jgi:branched-subunit amino acid transport protein